MPDILLIRHGTRDSTKDLPDQRQPLSPKGRQEVEKLVEDLRAGKRTPTLYLTSRNVHAVETARLISGGLGPPVSEVVELDALTPGTDSLGHFMEVKNEARAQGYDLDEHQVLAIVAHQPRLNQLFAYLTTLQTAPLKRDYGWAVRVTAHKTNDFDWGNASGQWS